MDPFNVPFENPGDILTKAALDKLFWTRKQVDKFPGEGGEFLIAQVIVDVAEVIAIELASLRMTIQAIEVDKKRTT